jgi:hypothetical protein
MVGRRDPFARGGEPVSRGGEPVSRGGDPPSRRENVSRSAAMSSELGGAGMRGTVHHRVKKT